MLGGVARVNGAAGSSPPTVGSQKRDEPDGGDVTPLKPGWGPGHFNEHLFVTIAQRDQQSPTWSELVDQWLRDRWRRGTYEDRIVGCVLVPPDRSVSQQSRHVADVAEPDDLPGLIEELWHSLHRKNLGSEVGEEHGLVAGASSDLEGALVPLEVQEREVAGMDRRLRDSLSMAYWQRRIFVRTVPDGGGYKKVSRGQFKGPENREIGDSSGLQRLDEPASGTAVFRLYGACHQLSGASRMSRWVRSRCRGVTDM